MTEVWLSLRREDIQVETSDSVLAGVECGEIQQRRDARPRPPRGPVLLCSCQRREEDVTHSMGKQPRVEEQSPHHSNRPISSIPREYISVRRDSPIISSVPHLVYCVRIYQTRGAEQVGAGGRERVPLGQKHVLTSLAFPR